ncbi:alpha-2-macroglobulin family protein [Pseudofulvibacter geojedonensis]|uniref:MG2 domain-containing protein n=1 Tax=Pseudofulvibacter geojedonensis TaxID=1123758 RepID=A0ABW3I4K3_9FLAO
MNKLIILFGILFMTQSLAQQGFEKHWKIVENYELEGKTKSANEVVTTIYKKAKKKKNDIQLIKSLVYLSKFSLTLEEDSELKIVQKLENEISNARFPANAILTSILADFKWQYLQQHRWQIYNRTKTDQVNQEDFRTWDLNTLFTSIHNDFNNSISNDAGLQNIPVTNYRYLLIQGTDTENLRPSLYDLLAHRALQFFKTDESRITKPKERFYIDNVDYFSPSNVFSELVIETNDSIFSKYPVLKTYQKLEQFHLEKKQPEALIEAFVERLQFVKNNSTLSNNKELYIESLEKSLQQYTSGNSYAFLKAHYAQALYDVASLEYLPKNRKKALDITEEIMESHPNTEASVLAQNLQSIILQPTLQLQNEQVVPSNSASKVWIQFNNVKELYLTVYQVTLDYSFYQYNYQDRETKINEFFAIQKALESVKVNLPQKGDYFNHSTEALLPKLELGNYIVLATPNKDFNKNDLFAYSSFTVSNLSVVESDYQGKKIFQVLNSSNGKPINRATVKFGSSQKSTDKWGEASFSGKRQNDLVIVSYQNDSLSLGKKYHYNGYRKPKDDSKKERAQAFLFLDRSIYRPGQKVHFKGIVLARKDYKSNVVSNKEFEVIIRDVNYQEIKSFELTTNDYGSFSESFELPKDVLTGNFTIEIQQSDKHFKHFSNAYTNFSVEEYKRPKFEVNFNPVKESFSVNDNICVTGTAKALLGTNISNAKVTYNIVRKTQFNHWRYWSRHYDTNEQEIAHGEVTTNDKGEFDINFNALADQTKKSEDLPVFNYEITANVTDINGETRTATTTVKVGYHSLVLGIQTTHNWDTNKEQKITIESNNLNGEFLASQVTIKIYKLKAPQYLLRNRRLPIADSHLLSKEEFKKYFPHEAYANEDDFKNWEKGGLVYETVLDTEKKKEIDLDLNKWISGKYIIVAKAEDDTKHTITQEKFVSVFNPNDKYLTDKQWFNHQVLNSNTVKKDGYIAIKLQTASKDLVVFTEAFYNNERFYREELTIDGYQTIRIPLDVLKKYQPQNPEAYVSLQFSMTKHQDFRLVNATIDLSIPEDELVIETKTFRDKLQPGSKEKWSFTIKNKKGKNTQAEVLASMYDASLDQFKPHNWIQQISIRDYYRNGQIHRHCNTFKTDRFTIKNPIYITTNSFSKIHNKLNHFGFGYKYQYEQEYNNYLFNKVPRGKGETITISGVIVDENNLPLPGATVLIKGSTIGTSTDFDGKYSLQAKKGDLVEISYVGYATKSIPVTASIINYTLQPDNNLDEIVVTAYGKKRKAAAITASNQVISSVSSNASGIANSEEMEDSEELDYGYEQYPLEDLEEQFKTIAARKNLNETAFFYPHIKTDTKGNLQFEFESPEALTRWKLQLFGHTKTGVSGKLQKEVVTQKELMVIPNPPRFLREGDSLIFQTKISSLSDKVLNGQAKLELYNAVTGEEISPKLMSVRAQSRATQGFTLQPKGNTSISWNLVIPEGIPAVEYKVLAIAENFSDGELNVLPVLTNKMLVTESIPITVKANSSKEYSFKKLLNNQSKTLRNHQITLEYTTNPAWYAIQSLPYVMEYPYECAEQTFARYYGNALGAHIMNSNPKIKQVFDLWKANGKLTSKLEQNEELKQILIAETPWLRDAQSDAEKKKQLALLFDLEKLTSEEKRTINKLQKMQLSSGAFPWFDGGRANEHITRHIVAGVGHLNKLNVRNSSDNLNSIISKAIDYLDNEFIVKHKRALKHQKEADIKASYYHLHYLYTRSFFTDSHPFSKEVQKLVNFYLPRTKEKWLSKTLLQKTLLAIVSERYGDTKLAKTILENLQETAIVNDGKGMYWKSNKAGWYWNEAPIETQALIIEAFAEISKDQETIENLQVWLLNNKRKNSWDTTKATTEAVYALLLQGNDWLSVEGSTNITIGNEKISTKKLDETKLEAGTGYIKTSWNTDEIQPKMGSIKIKNKSDITQYGGYYWQYFEQLDQITSETHKSDIQLSKKLFLKEYTDAGIELKKISDTKDNSLAIAPRLKVGDLVKVRIELQVKDNFEFVHLKDMRASTFEPVDVLSGYKWQDGLGYYQSTKDVATHFFFDYLPKGTYVLEYEVRVNNSGSFSNGISTIQNMYAPEFSSHSKGIRININ